MMMFMRFLRRLSHRLITKALQRPPDVLIGGRENPYMRRWWIIPRNPIFNVYLHEFLRSDDDRALHDHPWINMSILLEGPGYDEIVPVQRFGFRPTYRTIARHVGDIVIRLATSAHRIALLTDETGKPRAVWSLFITGPRLRTWGFLCPQGWRRHDVFAETKTDEHGQQISVSSRGCD